MARKIGIAWYRSWEWEKLRQAAHDSEQLASTHREWMREARKGFSELRAAECWLMDQAEVTRRIQL